MRNFGAKNSAAIKIYTATVLCFIATAFYSPAAVFCQDKPAINPLADSAVFVPYGKEPPAGAGEIIPVENLHDPEERITINVTDGNLKDIVKQLSMQSGRRMAVLKADAQSKVSLKFSREPLGNILQFLISDYRCQIETLKEAIKISVLPAEKPWPARFMLLLKVFLGLFLIFSLILITRLVRR